MPWLLLDRGAVNPTWRRVRSCQYFHAGVIGCPTPPKPIPGDAKAGLAVPRRTHFGLLTHQNWHRDRPQAHRVGSGLRAGAHAPHKRALVKSRDVVYSLVV